MSKYNTSGNPTIFGENMYGVGEGAENEEWHINPDGFSLITEGVVTHGQAYFASDILNEFDKSLEALKIEIDIASKQPLMIQGYTRDGVFDLFDYTPEKDCPFFVDIEIWIETHELELTDTEHKEISKVVKTFKQAVKYLLLKLKNDLAQKQITISIHKAN